MDEKIVSKVFDEQAQTYGVWNTPFDEFLENYEKEKIMQKCISKGSILDVGTGRGRYAIELNNKGLKIVGIDISRKMLLESKDNSKSIYPLIQSTPLFLPFKENIFEEVLFVRSLKYMRNYYNVLNEVHRVLKPNGRLIIYEVGNVLSLHYLFHGICLHLRSDMKSDDPLPYYKFSILSLKDFLHRKGFDNIEVQGYLHLPRKLYKKLPVNLVRILFKIENFIDHLMLAGILGYSFLLLARKR